MSCRFYYKILTRPDFLTLQRELIFKGNAKDHKSGFIHMCSSLEQCDKVLKRSYDSIPVYILGLQFKRHVNIVTEKASDGDFYPHLYGEIMISDVSTSREHPHLHDQ